MKTVMIPCSAESGLFSNELIIKLETKKGDRTFFVNKSNYIEKPNGEDKPSGYITALVLREEGTEIILSIPGEPADLHASQVWMKTEDIVEEVI